MSSFLSLVATPLSDSIIPDEIIIEILLRLPTKLLSRFMCVSKPWHKLISSPDFIKTHLKLISNDKEYSHHRVLLTGIGGNFNFCSFPPLFNEEQCTELFPINSPIQKSYLLSRAVGSVDGLICLFNQPREIIIWNPTISKSKELHNFRKDILSFDERYGFGYDKSNDEYKVVFVDYCSSTDDEFSPSNMRTVVSIYSSRTDSLRTVHDQLQHIYLVNDSGKFVNKKIYWVSSTEFNNHNVRSIISFDVADETWESMELPFSGEDDSYFELGVMESNLALLYTSHLHATTSNLWILKHCGVDVSWTKLFNIKYPRNAGGRMCIPQSTLSIIHFCQSNNGDILILLPPVIMIYDGSTRELKHVVDVGRCFAEEIYLENLLKSLSISNQGRQELGVIGKVPWKQPLAEMQGKAEYDTPLWWGPSPDTAHSETPFAAVAPPVFKGEGYHVWDERMEAHIEANDP
ncbi:putative F-box/kelch-repeat protein-like isoform X2 [Capsicum annuum]|nr:putative F-box/kelch-repeat protein-like isoform X2 [Capsicum annuum]